MPVVRSNGRGGREIERTSVGSMFHVERVEHGPGPMGSGHGPGDVAPTASKDIGLDADPSAPWVLDLDAAGHKYGPVPAFPGATASRSDGVTRPVPNERARALEQWAKWSCG